MYTLRKIKLTLHELLGIALFLFIGGVVGTIILVLYLMMEEGVFQY